MWEYCDKSGKGISLHDCIATHVNIDKSNLLLEFTDGFWITRQNKLSRYEGTFCTDKAQVCITQFDICHIYIFHELRIFRRLIHTKRTSVSLEKIISNINYGHWKLEFITEYHAFNEVLYYCWIWDNKRHHKECQICLNYEEIQYFWNNICEDKPW